MALLCTNYSCCLQSRPLSQLGSHMLLQAIDKAFDNQLDICKALRDSKFDKATLNQVSICISSKVPCGQR